MHSIFRLLEKNWISETQEMHGMDMNQSINVCFLIYHNKDAYVFEPVKKNDGLIPWQLKCPFEKVQHTGFWL